MIRDLPLDHDIMSALTITEFFPREHTVSKLGIDSVAGSAEGAGGETASGAHGPMCDAHANEAAAEFDLKHAGKSKKKQQSCTRITHFIGNHDIG